MKKLLTIITIFIIGFLGCQSSNSDSEKKPGTSTALAFEMRTLEGSRISSTEFIGNVQVVDFWATWCRPCIKEIPDYNFLNRKFKNDNVKMIGIAMDSGDTQIIKSFVSKYNMEYSIYIGDAKTSAAFGGIQVFPTTFVIDQKGNIQKKFIGAHPKKIKAIELLVKNLLAKE